jgi:hypothetical protein
MNKDPIKSTPYFEKLNKDPIKNTIETMGKFVINYSKIINPYFILQSRDPNLNVANTGFSKTGTPSSNVKYIDTEFALRIIPALTSLKIKRINSLDKDKNAQKYLENCKENPLKISESDPEVFPFDLDNFPFYDCLKTVENSKRGDTYDINSNLLLNILWFINYSESETLTIIKIDKKFEFLQSEEKITIIDNTNYNPEIYNSNNEKNISKTTVTFKGANTDIYKFIGIFKKYKIHKVIIRDESVIYSYTFVCFQIYNDRWYVSLREDTSEKNSYVNISYKGILELLRCPIIYEKTQIKIQTLRPPPPPLPPVELLSPPPSESVPNLRPPPPPLPPVELPDFNTEELNIVDILFELQEPPKKRQRRNTDTGRKSKKISKRKSKKISRRNSKKISKRKSKMISKRKSKMISKRKSKKISKRKSKMISKRKSYTNYI